MTNPSQQDENGQNSPSSQNNQGSSGSHSGQRDSSHNARATDAPRNDHKDKADRPYFYRGLAVLMTGSALGFSLMLRDPEFRSAIGRGVAKAEHRNLIRRLVGTASEHWPTDAGKSVAHPAVGGEASVARGSRSIKAV